VIRETQPEVAAVESLFAARNAASALKLGHARGVALLALVHGGLTVHDYAPSEVKQAVVGTGRGQKEQVAQMIRNLLGLKEIPPPDAADALAVAVCQLMHRALPGALATRRSPDCAASCSSAASRRSWSRPAGSASGSSSP